MVTVMSIINLTSIIQENVVVTGDCAWWLSGGVSSSNCIIAYQPIHADDYADSKINLANPGVYDAADGANYPTWADATGWTFNAASSQRLTSSYHNDTKPFTFIAHIQRGTASPASVIACNNGGGIQYRVYNTGGYKQQLIKRGVVNIGTSSSNTDTDDVIAVTYDNSGNYEFFLNGSPDGSGTNNQTFSDATLEIGGSSGEYYTGNILSMAIYNTVLTDEQISSISSAMAAL